MSVNVAKNRLSQTFRFLKELNELKNPIPREISEYPKVLGIDQWPSHPFVEVRRGDRADDDSPEGSPIEPLIRVRRANLTSCPKPPEALDGWLKSGWQSVDA